MISIIVYFINNDFRKSFSCKLYFIETFFMMPNFHYYLFYSPISYFNYKYYLTSITLHELHAKVFGRFLFFYYKNFFFNNYHFSNLTIHWC